jgi:site-specific DNA-methyltransferase (adenine-specific)
MPKDVEELSAASVGSPVPFTPYYDRDGITIYNADCRKVLPFLDRFDLLLTDPPYGLGSRLTGGKGEWSTHFEKSPEWDHVLSPCWLIRQCVDVAGNAIVWGGNYYELLPTRCWLSWDKMQEHTSGHFEMAWTNLDKPTRTFRMSRVEAHADGKAHPTQKPLPLMRWCLGLVPGAVTVLDPFMGSGTTLVACKLDGRKAVGIEVNEGYCEAAANRLSQGTLF